MPAGDALGRLVITLSLTACMGGMAVAATFQTTFLKPASPLAAGPVDAPGLTADAPASGALPARLVATASLAGHVLPLPTADLGSPPHAIDGDAGRVLAEVSPAAGSPRGSHGPAAASPRGSHGDVGGVVGPLAAAPENAAPRPGGEPAAGERRGWSAGGWLVDAPASAALPVLEAEHVVVQRGETLLEILLRSGIDRAEAHEVVGTLSTLYDPRRLRVGQAMALEVERAGDALAAPRLAALSLNLDFGNDLRVERDANGDFAARKVDRELTQTVHAAHAVIDGSLYQTARRHAVPDEALVNLANIFSWDLDFQRDVHPGDSFEIVYERVESPDGEVRGGDVLFASLKLRGRQVHAYRYQHADGTTGYYDADGRSLRKWLMRTPIDGARLSSGFGPRRHPILGYNRMHRGVDFAAPTGTPIYAAGDGEITRIGRNGAYGNFIQIRHNNEFSTAYAHMSRFADGLKNGSRVRQGQVIAYVGSTGRSTGPHLHYEVLQDGQQINPMAIKPQTAARLAGADLERFRRQIETIDAKRPAAGAATTLAQR